MTVGSDNNFWTDERLAVLKRDFAAGLSFSQIAKRIGRGCTRNAALGKAHRIGLTRNTPTAPPVWTKERTKRLIELWCADRTAEEIGSDLGVTAHAVTSKVHGLRVLGLLPRAARSLTAPSVRRAPRAGNGSNMKGAKSGGRPAVIFGPITLGAKAPFHGKPRAFSPLRGATPIPWTERAFGQCAWPVGGEGADTLSCASACGVETYCAAHLDLRRNKNLPAAKASDLARSLRRYVA